MSNLDLIAEWSSEPFLHDAAAWVDATLASHDVVRTGPLHPHKVRFWAAVYQVPTTVGPCWFKACTPPLGHEPALTQAIANVAPHLVLTPLGIDPERHWMLTPDGGPTVRDSTDKNAELGSGMVEAVRVAAAMQQDLMAHRATLHNAGLPVMEATDAEAYFFSELTRLAAFPTDHPAHIDAVEARELRTKWAHARPDMDLLARSAVPSSLQHNDLHDANIFSPHRTGHYAVFDLGDAVWSHPFAVLKVALDTASSNDVMARHLREAYLQAWEEYGSAEQLSMEADAAYRLGALQQYRSWASILNVVNHPAMAAQFAYVPRLGDLLARVVTDGL